MDPLTALSLASSVIQIVDFSTKLVTKGHKIYKSADGTLSENVDTEMVDQDLNQLTAHLQHTLRASNDNAPLNQADISLVELCRRCNALSLELQTKLNKLKVVGKHRKWKSARQALKSVCGRDNLEQFAHRLAIYRDEINLNITVSLR